MLECSLSDKFDTQQVVVTCRTLLTYKPSDLSCTEAILLLPVRVRHIDNAPTWFPTLVYSIGPTHSLWAYFSAANNIQRYHI